jgi:hypothetical protein
MHVTGLDPGIASSIQGRRPRIITEGAAWMPGSRSGMTRRRKPPSDKFDAFFAPLAREIGRRCRVILSASSRRHCSIAAMIF